MRVSVLALVVMIGTFAAIRAPEGVAAPGNGAVEKIARDCVDAAGHLAECGTDPSVPHECRTTIGFGRCRGDPKCFGADGNQTRCVRPVTWVPVATGRNTISALSEGTGVEFLSRLKAIADQGELFDPPSVAKALDMELQPKSSEDVIQPTGCNPGLQQSLIRTELAPKASWYAATSSAMPHMLIPKTGPMTREAVIGDPSISYLIVTQKYCSDLINLSTRSAQLRFDNLPGYSCIHMDDVTSVMKIEDDHATDGGGIYSYGGKQNDKYGTSITLFFGPFGSSMCLLGVTVGQDENFGLKIQRARQKFKQCTNSADHEFCATHPPFGWGDGAVQDQMAEYSAKRCGGFGSFFQREAASGRPPPPAPPIRSAQGGVPSTPCDGK